MLLPHKWIACALSIAALLCASGASAQDAANSYPDKAIRVIVPAPAGGPSDVLARRLSEKLTTSLGQPVLVENKLGAGQTLGTAFVAKAPPDGYTLLITTSTPIVMMPVTSPKIATYDVARDFTAVAHVASTSLVLFSRTSLPVTSVNEVITLARKSPGTLSYGSHGTGTSAQVLGEYLKKQAGIDMIHVPYSGTAPQLNALVAGQIDLGIMNYGIAAPHVLSGKIRPLAVAASKRSPDMPDVPTFAELGIVGMEPFSPWWGVFAPAATPRPIVDKLSAEIVKAAKSPDFQKFLTDFAIESSALGTGPANKVMLEELARWKSIMTNDLAGLKME